MSDAIDPAHVAAMEGAVGRAGRDRLLRLVADHARRTPDAIRAALATGDVARARSEAHGLRGAVGSFGAERLSAVLHRIEHGPAPDAELDALAREASAVADAAEELLGG